MSTKLYRSISSKITMIVIISVVVSTSIIGSLFYYKGRAMFIDNAALTIQNRLQSSTLGFENYYKRLKIDLKFLSYINEKTNNDIEVIYHNLHKFYYDQFYIAKIDKNLYYSDFFKKNKSVKDFLFKKEKLTITDFEITDLHRFNSKFAFQWAIYRSEKYLYLIKINFIELLSTVFVGVIHNHDHIYVLNEYGQYLYSPDYEKNFVFEQNIDARFYRDHFDSKKYFKRKTSFHYKGEIANDAYLFAFKYLNLSYLRNKLYFGIALNLDQHLYSYNLIRTKTVGLTFLIIILTVIAGIILSKFLTKNLKIITHAAQDYMVGKINIDLESIKINDEIGILAKTFQSLIGQLNERSRLQNKQEKNLRIARDEAENTLREKSFLLENLNTQKNKLEHLTKEKDDLMAIVSHDLKNPLSVIDASMDLIREDSESTISTMSNDLIKRSKNAAKISLQLITDLLDLARFDGGIKLEYSKFNLLEMLTTSLDVFDLKLKDKNITLEIKIPENLFLQADFFRLSQVVNNLVGNSIKFTSKNGKIIITGDNIDGNLNLKLSDNGIGIPEDKIDNIFNKFSQARESDRKIGTGLGLAICKKICELHKGSIWVTSILGKGTNFHVKIPGSSIDQRSITQSKTEHLDHSTSEENSSVKTILLVEDDDDIRLLIYEVLEEYKFSILKAKSSKEAVYLIKNNKVDFIISDYQLVDEDGLTLIKKCRKISDISSILISGSLNVIPEVILTENKIIKFLHKPFKLNILAEILEKHFDIDNSEDENLSQVNILFVDDSDDIRTLVRLLLKKRDNIKLSFAEDGQQAIETIQKNFFDFVFMDDQMPVMTGVEAMMLLKSDDQIVEKNCKFISMSANNTKVDQQRYLKAGFELCLGKPVTKKSLLNIIDKNNLS